MYMILGYTELTDRIAAYIKDTLKEEVTIILDDEQVASDLRESGYGIVVGKPRNMTTLTRARLKDEADVVVVMGETSRETREICETIKREYPEKFLVAIAERKADAANLKRLQVEKVYHNVSASADALAASQKSRRLVKGWISATIQNHATGLASAKEVKDALTEYFKVMAAIHKLTNDYNVGVAELARVTGTIERDQ